MPKQIAIVLWPLVAACAAAISVVAHDRPLKWAADVEIDGPSGEERASKSLTAQRTNGCELPRYFFC
jgi:hypothetical protein